jgi:uncharacterized protein involved in exopolysaccharide biosynthesis
MTSNQEQPDSELSAHLEKQTSLQDILPVIWSKRKSIFFISLIVALATWGINFLIPDYYKSTATLLPSPQKGKISGLGQLADVATLAGVNVPGSEVSRLYPSILNSETVLRDVIEHSYHVGRSDSLSNLIQYFEVDEGSTLKDIDLALKTLRSATTIAFDARTGIVSIAVVLGDPQLAADVSNVAIAGLDRFMREKQTSNASEQVSWLDTRLNQVESMMRRAEETLKDFREKNRRIQDSPELLLRQDRLVRDVQVNSTVFIELKKQYELAKLEEIKNMQIVNVLDPGRPAAVKIGPKRKTNAIIAFVLMLFGASAFYVLRDLYKDRIRRFGASLRVPHAANKA